MENQAKENIKEKKDSFKKHSKIGKTMGGLIDGTILTHENTIKILPFIFYLTFLAIIYIANTYYAGRIVRKTELLKTELRELRNQHISTKSELMSQSKQSEIAEKLEMLGIKESKVPPQKIYVNKDDKFLITK